VFFSFFLLLFCVYVYVFVCLCLCLSVCWVVFVCVSYVRSSFAYHLPVYFVFHSSPPICLSRLPIWTIVFTVHSHIPFQVPCYHTWTPHRLHYPFQSIGWSIRHCLISHHPLIPITIHQNISPYNCRSMFRFISHVPSSQWSVVCSCMPYSMFHVLCWSVSVYVLILRWCLCSQQYMSLSVTPLSFVPARWCSVLVLIWAFFLFLIDLVSAPCWL